MFLEKIPCVKSCGRATVFYNAEQDACGRTVMKTKKWQREVSESW